MRCQPFSADTPAAALALIHQQLGPEAVAALEREVQQLKSRKKDYSRWLDKIEGSMENDSDFAEILRLGSEIRKADFS